MKYGGMVTKLKDNFIKILRIIGIFVIVILVCYGLFYYFDNVWSGIIMLM